MVQESRGGDSAMGEKACSIMGMILINSEWGQALTTPAADAPLSDAPTLRLVRGLFQAL